MKKLSIAFLSLTMLSSAAFAEDKVVASYKGGEIKGSQVMNDLKGQLGAQLGSNKIKNFEDFSCEDQEKLVHAYINNILLKQEVENSNILSSKEFQEKLEAVKMQLAQQELLSNYIKSRVTDRMIDDEYNKLVENLKGKEEVKAAHILVKSEKEANEIIKKLNKGQNFGKLAKSYSIDASTKNNDGVIGSFIANQIGGAIAQAYGSLDLEKKLSSLKVKQHSTTPVKTDAGWHILTVLERKPFVVPSKEEAKVHLSNKLGVEELQKFIANLETKADVKINISCKKPEGDQAVKTNK